MLEFDIEAIKAAGLDVTSPIVICNTDDYKDIKATVGNDVNTMDTVLTLVK
jgi:PTS system beta-glucosides-specific IIC component